GEEVAELFVGRDAGRAAGPVKKSAECLAFDVGCVSLRLELGGMTDACRGLVGQADNPRARSIIPQVAFGRVQLARDAGDLIAEEHDRVFRVEMGALVLSR